MKGYRGDPERTAEAVDSDGWMYTGDIATIDEDGYVRIVDRKKELIINSGGKNMSPATSRRRSSRPARSSGRRWPSGTGVRTTSPSSSSIPTRARPTPPRRACPARTRPTSVRIPASRPSSRRRWPRPTASCRASSRSSGSGSCRSTGNRPATSSTPTMKLKRKPIAAKYADVIEALYAGKGNTPAQPE